MRFIFGDDINDYQLITKKRPGIVAIKFQLHQELTFEMIAQYLEHNEVIKSHGDGNKMMDPILILKREVF